MPGGRYCYEWGSLLLRMGVVTATNGACPSVALWCFPASIPCRVIVFHRSGSMLLKASSGKLVGVINLIGRTYMRPAASPFFTADRLIHELSKKTNIMISFCDAFLDFRFSTGKQTPLSSFEKNRKTNKVFSVFFYI